MSCSWNQLSIKVTRHYGSDPREETAIIKSPTKTLLTMKYTGSVTNYFYICVSPGVTHTLRLMDEYGDGWSSSSYVELTYQNQRVIYGQLLVGYVVDLNFVVSRTPVIPVLPTTEAPSFIEQYGLYFLFGFLGVFILIMLIVAISSCNKNKKALPRQQTKQVPKQ